MEKLIKPLFLFILTISISAVLISCGGDEEKEDEPEMPKVSKTLLTKITGDEIFQFSYNPDGCLSKIYDGDEFTITISYNPILINIDGNQINVTTNNDGYIKVLHDEYYDTYTTYTYDSAGHLTKYEMTFLQSPGQYEQSEYTWENDVITHVILERYVMQGSEKISRWQISTDIEYSGTTNNGVITQMIDNIFGYYISGYDAPYLIMSGLFGKIPSKLPSKISSFNNVIEADECSWHDYNIIYRTNNEGNPIREEIIYNYSNSYGGSYEERYTNNYSYETICLP
ncbi:MAG: hypothetical protein NC039_04205 [Muribaculaceae bacterium]|nr:hypothetical protein [Muribaculaceae bacterium]